MRSSVCWNFDLVVTRYALHHFPEIEKSMGEVARVLKSNGILIPGKMIVIQRGLLMIIDRYLMKGRYWQ